MNPRAVGSCTKSPNYLKGIKLYRPVSCWTVTQEVRPVGHGTARLCPRAGAPQHHLFLSGSDCQTDLVLPGRHVLARCPTSVALCFPAMAEDLVGAAQG
jgi:hypothetical protein